MFIDVYKLIFRKLEKEIVHNVNFVNKLITSYTHRMLNFILLKDRELSSHKCSYHHIHNTY